MSIGFATAFDYTKMLMQPLDKLRRFPYQSMILLCLACSVSSCEENVAPDDVASTLGGVKEAAVPGIQLSVPSESLVFPPQVVGQPPTPQLLQFVASGTQPVYIADVVVEGAEFSLVTSLPTGESLPSIAGASIPAKSVASIQVQFFPTTEGLKSGKVRVRYGASDATAKDEVAISLEGTGILTAGNLISIAPPTVNFGTAVMGVTIASKEITVVNSGVSPSFLGASVIEGDGPFASEWTDCPADVALEPGTNCKLRVSFLPIEGGNYAGTLRVPYGKSPAELTASATSILSGSAMTEAAAGAAALSLTGEISDFGYAEVGESTKAKRFTLAASNISDVYISSISSNAADFEISNSTCPQDSDSLTIGEKCTFDVRFSPVSSGIRPATIAAAFSLAPGGKTYQAITNVLGTGRSPLVFSGLQSISGITGRSVQLNWNPATDGVAYYQVFSIDTDGEANFVDSALAPNTNIVIDDLTPDTTYKFRVRAFDTSGVGDTNTHDISVTTLPYVPPTVTAVSPTHGAKAGGNTLTIAGTGFRTSATVTIGSSSCPVTSLSATSIACTLPAKNAGVFAVTVTNSDGQSANLNEAYTYEVSFGGIASISQVKGTSMQLNWVSSAEAVSYLIYSVDASNVATYHSSVIAPATNASVVGLTPNTLYRWRVRASDQNGAFDPNTINLSATTLGAAPPTVTSVAPIVGSVAGGTPLTIDGTGFAAGATVQIKDLTCGSVVVVSATRITCTSPAGPGGSQSVTVTNSDGQTGSLSSGFSYIVPFAGLASIDDITGVSVRLNWTSISEAVSYQIYTVPNAGDPQFVKAVAAPAANSIVTNLSPNTTYNFLVRAFDSAGYNDGNNSDVSATTLASPPPAISSLSPQTGLVSGGELLTITGTSFVAGATVTIGSSPCSSVTVVSATSITCLTPALAAGDYGVTITNPDTQFGYLANAFTFAVPFNGLQSIDNITGVAMRLNWGVSAVAVSYQIYSVDNSGTATFNRSVPAPATSVDITGLTPNTAYKWRVRAYDALGASDVNVNDLQASTLANAPPVIASVSPTTSALSGNATLTITGSGFLAGATAVIGSSPCTSMTVVSATTITCTLPTGTAGAKSISVTNTDSQSSSLASAITYQVTFAGVTSISNITGSTMRLNWTQSPDAAAYQVYQIAGDGSAAFFTTIPAPASYGVVSGLTPQTSYTWRVRAFDSTGASDTNAATQTATTIAAQPSISSISPAQGPKAGTGTLTITGTNFLAGASITVGGQTCSSVSVVNSTQATCLLAARAAGPAAVIITNSDGQAATSATDYTYIVSFAGLGSINAISGTAMTLNWTTSSDAASYQIYSVNGSGQQTYHSSVVGSATSATISGLSPNTSYKWRVRAVDSDGAIDPNTVDVTATTMGNAPPEVTGISPTSGTVAGGTSVTLTGTGFLAGLSISIGGSSCAAVSVVSATQATCTTPAKAGGSYNVTATNSDGQYGSLTAGFAYIVPFAGLASIDQISGVSMRLNWTGITEAASYQVYSVDGGGQATFVKSIPAPASSTTVSGLSPNTLYRFRVRAFDVGGYNDGNSGTTDATTLANPPPTVTAITPGSGLASGNETITVSGTGFLAGATVTVGSSTCSSPTIGSGTSLTCQTPAMSAGSYSVTVTNSDGQSGSLASAFAYTIPFSGLQSIDTITGTSMRLNWGVSSGAVSYQIYSVDGAGNPTFDHTVAAPAVTTTITGLTPGTSYKWRVRAFDSQGISDINTVDVAATTMANAPPSLSSVSPTTSTLTAGGTLTINGSGFLAGITATIGGNSCTGLTVVSAIQVTCTIPTGSAGPKTVVVTNADGQSASLASALTYYVTFGGLANISNITGTTMQLNWTASPDAASYQVYQVTGGTTLTYRTSVAAPATSATLTGLTPLTSYSWRVRAFDASGAYDDNASDVGATTIAAPPVIANFSPSSGPKTGGGTLTINGSGFAAGATVTVGGTACTGLTVVSASQITCTIPAHAAGASPVIVTNSDAQAVTAGTSYTYVVTFGGLASVSNIKGNAMTLNWSTSADASNYHAYLVDGSGNMTYVSSIAAPATSMTMSGLSPNTSYKWRVRAFDSDGASDTNAIDVTASTLTNAPPTVTGVTPSSASLHLGGSQTITVSGTGFLTGATVTVGGSSCTGVSVVSSSSITCTAPALATGSYAVSVTNTDAQGASQASAFSYYISFGGLSSITGIGGTTMTLNWSSSPDAVSYYIYRIDSGSPVYVATVSHPTLTYQATGLSINTSYRWRVRAADVNGDQDTNVNDIISSTLANLPPSLASVSPTRGPLAGGGTLTLTGTDFLAGATITVGGTACSSVVVSSGTTATCTLAAKSAGSYDVVITNSDGQASTLTSGYTYQAAPTVASLDPDSGVFGGGTVVTVHGTGFVTGATVSIGGVACSGASVVNSTELTCTTGAYTNNTIRKQVNAVVTNSDGQQGTLADAYIYTVDNLSFVAGQPYSTGCTDGNGSAASVRFGGTITGMYSTGTYLYVADSVNNMIRRIKYSDNSVQLVAGRRCISGTADGALGTGSMVTPYGMTILGNYLYFVDQARHTVRRVDITATASFGTMTTVAGINNSAGYVDANGTAAKFSSPRAITTDGTYLYVADTGNHNIRKIDPNSSFAVTTFAGSNLATPAAGSADAVGTAATMNSPRDVVFYTDSTSAAPATTDYLLVVTAGDHRIRAVRISDRNVTTPAGGTAGWVDGNNTSARFEGPQDIAISGSYAYVSDNTRHMIRRIDLTNFSTFTVSTIAGTYNVSNWIDGASTINRLANPYSIAVNGSKVYFGDASSTVRYVDTASSNYVGTWIGTNQQQKPAQASNGMGTDARFQKNIYGDVATDGTNVFVADYTNNVVRKIDPTITYAPKTFTVSVASPATFTVTGHGYSANTPVVLTTTGALPTGLTPVTATYFIRNPTANTFELATSPSAASINTSGTQSGTHTMYRPSVTNLSGTGTAGGANGNSIATATHNSPAGLAYDSSTNILYVSDYAGHVIRAIDIAAGTTTTIAGLYNTVGYNDDPVGTTARFNGPMSLDIDTSVTPHVLYVGEWTAGNHIKRIDLTGTYAVTTLVGALGVAGTNASVDGSGNSAQVAGVQDIEVASYTVNGTTYKKLFFANGGGHTLRTYDVSTGYVETIVMGGQGYQDTMIPSGSVSETQAAKFNTIRGLYWDGNHLLVADNLNSLVRWYDPTTGTVGTLLSAYFNQFRTYTNSTSHYDSMDNSTISGGTAVVSYPSGLTYTPGLGYIIANYYGIWKLQ